MRNYDLLTVIMVCLGRADTAEGKGVLNLLGTLLSPQKTPEEKKRILEEEYEIPMTVKLDKEVTFMCNFSEGIWEDGMERGMEKGIEQGMKQGMEKGMEKGMNKGKGIGREEERVRSLHTLMQNLGLTLEKAMDALSIPQDDRPKYASMMQ